MPHSIAASSSTTSIKMATPNPLMALVDAAALLSSSSSSALASSSSVAKPTKRTSISPSPTQSMMLMKTVTNERQPASRDDGHHDTTMAITPPVVAKQQLASTCTTATPAPSPPPVSPSASPRPTNGFMTTLCDALDDEHVDLLQWMTSSSSSSHYPSDGSSFTITDTKKFTKTVLPQKFNIRNMSSFLRKLYQLGFKRHHDKSTMNFDIFSHHDLLTVNRRGKNVGGMQTTTSVDSIKVEKSSKHDDGDDASRVSSSSKASMTTSTAVQPVAPSSSPSSSSAVVINGIESKPLPAMPSFPASSSASCGTAAATVELQQYSKGTMVSSSSLVPRLADVTAPDSDDTTDPAIKAALLAAARIQTSSLQSPGSYPRQTSRMSLSRIKIRHHLSIMDRLRLQHECLLQIEQQQQQASLIAMMTSKTNRNQSTTMMMGTGKARHMHPSHNN
mmetsp:Transcript_20803/g.49401  ORF Transcript_20803/g.49401 Transcript_20803/m.49401 type:complete len:447 (-) Transcript_20803:54-1394(-)